MELLSLTQLPLPRWVCAFLLDAISQEPGVGGRTWDQALSKIKVLHHQYQVDKGDAKAAEHAEKYVTDIQTLLVDERFDPVVGIPEDKLRNRCQRVITWAGKQVMQEPMMAEVINQARDIQMIAKGKSLIPRITLNRMLDTVIGVGTASDYNSEEAAPWQVVDHPGQVVDQSQEIVWWGFNESLAEEPIYWSKEEGETLNLGGLTIEPSKNYRYRESLAWRKGLMLAKERFIGIAITQIDGEEAYPHPFFDTILSTAVDPAIAEERSAIIRATNDLRDGVGWKFAGRENRLVKAQASPDVFAKAIFQVPPARVKMPKRLSYSQMSTLIGCPMKWALEYHGGLRLPVSQAIATGNQMIGKLCHRIIEDLYLGKNRIEVGPALVLAGLVPSTNPTSTAIYKALIAIKSGNSVVFSPHPSALNSIKEVVDVMQKKAEECGAPKDTLTCLTIPHMDGTNALMKHKDIALILATGGSAMVKAAYSSGNPALGVGPGNVPAFIERSADIDLAVKRILASKTFDNGTVCASEQAIVTENIIKNQVQESFIKQGGYFLNDGEKEKVENVIQKANGSFNAKIAGRSAKEIALMAGIKVPEETRVLIAEERNVGIAYPFSREKLSPLLSFYSEEDWMIACDRCIEILNYGGIGHTLAIHSNDEGVIREFALKKPASRVLVNTPSSQGAVGATTNLPPAMTLGCGAAGGSATSDNVGPLNLIDIRRLAYGVKEPEDLSEEFDNANADSGLDLEKITKLIMEQLKNVK